MKRYSLETIKELSDNDKSFIHAMVSTFLTEIPEDMTELAQAVLEGNRPRSHEYSHKMKPSVEMFGLRCLNDVKVIEAWGKSEMDISVENELLRIQTDVELTIQEMRDDFAKL